MLTQEQIDFYGENGFLHIPQVFSKSEIDELSDEMDRLVLPAIGLVKVNRLAEAYAPLAEVVNSLASRGATTVVLGCTEIPLGIAAGPASGLQVPVVDTIDALARAAIAWARG